MRLPSALSLGHPALPPGHPKAGAPRWVGSRGRLLAAPRRGERSRGARPARARCHEGARAVSSVAPVLEGRELTKSFWVKQSRGLLARRARIHAVEGVTVRLDPGRVTALVGESGAGKTTVGRLLARIITPDAGDVLLDGRPAPRRPPPAYAAQGQMVFQDPFASLNPVHRVRHHLVRPLQIHHMANGDLDAAVADLLPPGALKPPPNLLPQFPPEPSRAPPQPAALAPALAAPPP